MSQPNADSPLLIPRTRSSMSDWTGYAVIGLVMVSYLAYRQLRPVPKIGQTHPAINSRLRDFHVEPLIHVDQPLDLEQLRGKVTLINLWGPWCTYCRQEIPHLITMAERWKDDLRIVSVSYPQSLDVSSSGLSEETAGAMRLMHAEFPVYQDPQVRVREYLQKAGVFWKLKFPCTVLMDRDLVIRGVWLEYQRGFEKEMSELVEGLVSAPQAAP